MSEEMAATAPSGSTIPVITVQRPDDDNDMSVDGEPDLDGLIEQEQEEMNQEKRNMESLCHKVQSVGLQPQPATEARSFRYTYIVLSDFDIGKDRFEHDNVEVRWVLVQRDTIKATVTIILNFIDDPSPKGLIIMCMNRFWQELNLPINDVMNSMRTIANRMSTVFVHNLVFATSPFLPCMEKKWPQAASLNLFIRNLNIEMSRTPLGIHKVLLRKVKSLGKMCVKGDMYIEFREGTGVGKTFTPEAIDKICKWIGQHCIRGMDKTVDHFTPLTVHDSEPESLSWTPGYKGDLMVGFIKQMGTYKPLPLRRNPNSKPYQRQQAQRNRDQKRDTLRPYLASIGRRPSTSASSSSCCSSGRASSKDFRIEEGDLVDQVRIVKLERDNQDLKNVLQTLKDKNEEERRDRRRSEETVSNTVQRLFGEIEWMIRDRVELASKLTKTEQALIQMKDDRDHISDELRRKKKD